MGMGLNIYFHRSQSYLCCSQIFELARCLVEKVGQGERLCHCVNSQIFKGYPGAGGKNGDRVEYLFS